MINLICAYRDKSRKHKTVHYQLSTIMVYALIMCAGGGSRAGLNYNKLLYKICGKCVLEYALDNFARSKIDKTALVHSETDRFDMEKIAAKYGALTCIGGASRSDSVRNGLRFLKSLGAGGGDIVLICDGARPNTSPELIAACIEAAKLHGGAVACVRVSDTLRVAENGAFASEIPRENTYAVQTPQAFRFNEIFAAYEKEFSKYESAFSKNGKILSGEKTSSRKAREAAYTDDGGVYAAAGYKAVPVPGSPENYKITYREELTRFEKEITNQITRYKLQITNEENAQCTMHNAQLSEKCHSQRSEESKQSVSPADGSIYRIGVGSDTHRLVAGRPLILGGVKIQYNKGLDGHSDADALAHAVADAALSAAGLRDIGFWFPDSDPKYKGADSMELLGKVCAMIEKEGFTAVNVSAAVSAEEPRLSPHIDAMRANIAKALNIGADCVGISAKTGEGMGFVGRKEGIAVIANALVKKM